MNMKEMTIIEVEMCVCVNDAMRKCNSQKNTVAAAVATSLIYSKEMIGDMIGFTIFPVGVDLYLDE